MRPASAPATTVLPHGSVELGTPRASTHGGTHPLLPFGLDAFGAVLRSPTLSTLDTLHRGRRTSPSPPRRPV